MAKTKTKFVCQECGYESRKWMGRCPGCQEWNTMVEEIESPEPKQRGAAPSASPARLSGAKKPQSINQVSGDEEPRLKTPLSELNRVLGGGIVPGSLVLVGGDPGIGKSTLLLQLSAALAGMNESVLYISGEESLKQTKLRADRLGVDAETLYVMPETNMGVIEQAIHDTKPALVIIDSIQTVQYDDVTSAPGSVAQVRESTNAFMNIAKQQGVAVFIVGHVTKQGSIAGPKMLEHMVDSVIYFEGERHHTYRILRAVKNRFGSTNEIGIFDMEESGLVEVKNPSEIFLEDRSQGASGSIVAAAMEGTRPVLVEIQALVAPTTYANPKRTATGLDQNRLSLLMAVLEKRVGMLLQNQDAYLNVAGGVKLDEPAVDLAMVVAIASSFRDQPTQPTDAVMGEVGLTGEIRRISKVDQRIKEAAKLGFTRAVIPAKNEGGWTKPDGIEIVPVHTLEEALKVTAEGSRGVW
ncbi:DNA repair protein RadA/Sms [Salsuginibacillus halophilus]|uniref:DNA repair protein RadA n=1 Tax=Salsuginibacillus halophilus TaxID=517424 RepID=A0A2P8H4Z4_9BACI|nr:DNA repair protein RadA [Salsuginibacillus halophilus]PSL41296.1 DNA repair protein RadA/Sms [Salsuginibacillus halophilus]